MHLNVYVRKPFSNGQTLGWFWRLLTLLQCMLMHKVLVVKWLCQSVHTFATLTNCPLDWFAMFHSHTPELRTATARFLLLTLLSVCGQERHSSQMLVRTCCLENSFPGRHKHLPPPHNVPGTKTNQSTSSPWEPTSLLWLNTEHEWAEGAWMSPEQPYWTGFTLHRQWLYHSCINEAPIS